MSILQKLRRGNNVYCIPGRFQPFLEQKTLNKRNTFLLPLYRNKLSNFDFSIFSNDCIGGVISHELRQVHRSPFVNLYVSPVDFIKVLENIDFYMSLDLINITKKDDVYPVGMIGDVKLFFIHYSNFKEAKDCWNRRKKRVNKNNLFVTLYDYVRENNLKEESCYIDNELLLKYLKLPYHVKVFTTDKNKRKYPNVIYLKRYRKVKDTLVPIDIELFGNKRCFDYKFDYVDWLNNNE